MAIPFTPISNSEEGKDAAFLKKLSELPHKPKRTRKQATLKEFVAKYYEHLNSAQERGYTYEELAELIFSWRGVSISAGTLRKYMAFAKKELKVLQQIPLVHSSDKASTPLSFPSPTNLTPDRQARLTRQKPESEDDIESQFSNL